MDVMKLIEAKKINERLNKELERRSKPKIENVDLVNAVFKAFCDTLNLDDTVIRKDKEKVRVFVLLCVWLFSPISLVGEQIRRGVRPRIAKIFEYHETNISNILRTSLNDYHFNKRFHLLVNDTYNDFLEELKRKDIIQ